MADVIDDAQELIDREYLLFFDSRKPQRQESKNIVYSAVKLFQKLDAVPLFAARFVFIVNNLKKLNVNERD